MANSPSPRPHENAYWATPHLLASEYPGNADPAVAAERLVAYGGAGVTAFLDLTHAHELAPYDALLPEGTLYRRMPIVDVSVPTTDEMEAILDQLDAWQAEGRRACVHCWGGIGRTGTVVGCHLVRHGATPQEALDHIDVCWKTVAKRSRYRRSPQTNEQFAFVRGWTPGP